MKKKWLVMMTAMTMTFSMAACGTVENSGATESASDVVGESVVENVETEIETTEAQQGPMGQHEQKSTEELLADAEAGSGRAYTDLGRMYEEGNGVEQDYAKAMEYYELSATAADPDFKGMRYAGLMYRDGVGVEQDYVKAAECFEQAADAGDVSAAYFLGLLYEEGNGVEQSTEKAKEWYEKAVSTVDEFLSNENNNGPDELKEALCKLAELALEEGDTDLAKTYYGYATELGWEEAVEALESLENE